MYKGINAIDSPIKLHERTTKNMELELERSRKSPDYLNAIVRRPTLHPNLRDHHTEDRPDGSTVPSHV